MSPEGETRVADLKIKVRRSKEKEKSGHTHRNLREVGPRLRARGSPLGLCRDKQHIRLKIGPLHLAAT